MNITAKPLLLASCLALGLTLAGCGSQASGPVDPPLKGATIGGEFDLVNTAGKPVRWGDFAGKYRIVYFGYAYCPDICPTDVQRTVQGLRHTDRGGGAHTATSPSSLYTRDPTHTSQHTHTHTHTHTHH